MYVTKDPGGEIDAITAATISSRAFLSTLRECYDAFVYYLERHALPDMPKCGAYSLTDCYVWQLERDNLRRDTGKNTARCDKEDMVLRSFMMMADMLRDPETYGKKLSDWKGMDQTM